MNPSNTQYCDLCGQTLPENSDHCPGCAAAIEPVEATSPRERGRPVSLLGALLGILLLAGLAWAAYTKTPYFRTAAVVNGEKISLASLENRVAQEAARLQRTGTTLSGQDRNRLRDQILDDLIFSTAIETKARQEDVSISAEKVEEEITRYRKAHGISDEKRYEQDIVAGFGSMDAFRNQLRNRMLIMALLEKTRVANGDAQPVSFNAWMAELKQNTTVTVNLERTASVKTGGCCNSRPSSATAASKCGSGGGCASAPGKADPDIERKIQQLALEKTRSRFGAGDYTVQVKDFGCHVEVEVSREARRIARWNYESGELVEL